jgi:hypothetical protein
VKLGELRRQPAAVALKSMIEKARLEEFQTRSLPKQARKAQKLVSNETIIAWMRFYEARLGSLSLNYYVPASELFRDFPNVKEDVHAYAARRSLSIGSHIAPEIPGLRPEETEFVMFNGWIWRLFHFSGLDLRAEGDLKAFHALNPNLIIDSAMVVYSESHPVLGRIKMRLNGVKIKSTRKRQRQPREALPPRETDYNPAPPPPASPTSEREMLLNKVQTSGATGGHISRETWDELREPEIICQPDPVAPPVNPYVNTAQDYMRRKLNGRR